MNEEGLTWIDYSIPRLFKSVCFQEYSERQEAKSSDLDNCKIISGGITGITKKDDQPKSIPRTNDLSIETGG